MDNRLHPLRASQRLLTYLVCGLIAWQPLLPAISATINPVTSGTGMDKAANGVPVMNIAKPNSAGISHNQFKDYNVGKEGLILNNATGQLNKTQLGGYIQNNPNLTAGREAKGIINEVTGGSRSQLQGYTEVAGKAANVIVANPYGITCSGCGFINTPNATLTTGKPVFDAKGNLQSLDVTKGTITVEGQGLDTSQSDALSIISRATEVNAAIHAKDLKVVAGANRVGSDGSVSAIDGEGDAPVVAVDTGALGGMYANRIHLVSGEKGVGVNLGNLNARQGDITLDANGKLVLNSSLSSGALTAKAESIELGGDNKASGSATVTAQKGIALNNGSLVSDKSVTLEGGERVQLTGAKVTAGEDVRLSAGELGIDKNSTADAAGDIGLTAKTGTASLNAQAAAADADSTVVQSQVNNAGQLTAGKNITLDADAADNSGSLVAKGTLKSTARQLTSSGKLVGDTLEVDAGTLDNRGDMLAGQTLKVAANTIQQSGTVSAKGSAAITARDSLVNRAGGSISSDNGLTIKTAQLTNNGTLSAAQLGLESDAITNAGLMQGTESLSLLSNSLDNQAQGLLLSDEEMQLSAAQLDNAGQLVAGKLTLTGDLLNNSGKVWGGSLLDVQTKTLNNLSGSVMLSGVKAEISADTLSNHGQIQADELTLNAQTFTNEGEWTAKNLQITGGSLDNNGTVNGVDSLTAQLTGKLTQQQNTTLQSGGLLTLGAKEFDNHGRIQGSTLQLNGDTLSNSGWLQATNLILNVAKAGNTGTLLAEQQATLTGDTLTSSGTIQANTLTADYQQLTNSGTLLGSSDLTLTSGQITQEAAGKLFSGGNLVLTGNGFDQLGQVVALGNATLKLADSLTAGGTIAAGKTLNITTGGALNNNGAMQGETVALKATGALTNGGEITGGSGDLTLSGNSITSSGSVQGGGDVNFTSNRDITLNGFTGAGGNITLNAPGTLLNTALMYAANNLYLYADSIKNQGGDILAGNSLWMQRDAAGNANTEIVNSSGTIETQDGDITINTGHLLNTRKGLSVSRSTTKATGLPAGIGAATLSVALGTLKESELGFYEHTIEYASTQGEGITYSIHIYMAPNEKGAEKKYLFESTETTAFAEGDGSSIISGQNAYITSTTLDNQASAIQANKMLHLGGSVLNNESFFNLVENKYLTYKYNGELAKRALNKEYSLSYFSPDREYAPLRSNTSSEKITYRLSSAPEYETISTGGNFRSVIQAGGNITASFSENISNTTTTANSSGVSTTLVAPALNTISTPNSNVKPQTPAAEENTQQWRDQLQTALQSVNGAKTLENGTGPRVDTSTYPVPVSDNGYFVTSGDPKSPYLITVNPALDGVGQLDQNLYGDLYKLLGQQPADAPQETRAEFADKNTFLGSAYMLGRLNLNPEYDYRFLGDAAFDTRYVNNTVLSQTGNRYLNGLGSDLDQMRYLMDNAATQQQSLGLQFGVALTAAQIASLDSSILWWEATTLNGETVMVPKLYLSPDDVTVSNGSVIAANNISLEGGSVTNTGSSLLASNDLSVGSQSGISNLNNATIKTGGALQLSAQGDINNIGSAISGKTVALSSATGSINNITEAEQWQVASSGPRGERASVSHTYLGNEASITAQEGLSLAADQNITVKGAELKAGSDLTLNAGGDIAITANTVNNSQSQSGFAFDHRRQVTRSGATDISQQGSTLSAGGNLAMQAGNNLTLSASSANAGKSASLAAGNDISLDAQTTRKASSRGGSESHNSGVARTTLTSGNTLTLTAGQDITSQAAALKAGTDIALQAGRDIDLQAQATNSGNSYRSGGLTEIKESVRQQGTSIEGGGNVAIIASRDLTSNAAQIKAQQDLAVAAGNNIDLNTATESDYAYREEIKTKKGFLSKTTTHTISERSSTNEAGTLLSGDNIRVQAGNDLLVQGSAVAGEGDIVLKAGNDVSVKAAIEKSSHYDMSSTKKSGVFSGGGLGITIGSQSTKLERKGSAVTESQSHSLVGTTGGNVIVDAGNHVTLRAADLAAARVEGDTARETGHIDVTGSDIAIIAGQDIIHESVSQSSKSKGLTISFSDPLINSLKNLRDIFKSDASGTTKVQQTVGEVSAFVGDLATNGGMSSLPVTWGQSSSNSKTDLYGEYQTASSLSAAGNVQLNATGNKGQGNALIEGSRVGAGEAVIIEAKDNIAIVASTDKEQVTSEASSSSWSITDAMPTYGSVVRAVSGGPNHGSKVLPFALDNADHQGDTLTKAQTSSQITGQEIYINSREGHVDVSGSSLAAINDLMLSAEKGNITVTTGNNSVLDKQSGSQTTVGELGGDGYTGTVGWRNDKYSSVADSNQQSTLRSQIVSQSGNVALQAAQDVSVNGADISAGKSLQLSGENVRLDVSEDRQHNTSESSSTQYGIKASTSGWAVSAVQALETAVRSAEDGDDPRLTAIYAAQAALNTATQTMQNNMDAPLVKVTVSATAGTSKEKQDYQSQQQQGSTLRANDSVIIRADQDIAGQGVDIAGKNVILDAGRDISLTAAQDTEKQNNTSSGSQIGVGVGVSLGGKQNGFTVELGASTSSGRENGTGLVNHNSKVTAEETLSVTSGRDTALNGAELSGGNVVANIGRDLTIASQQDASTWDSSQSSGGFNASICIPPFCIGQTVQGSVNYSAQKLNNNYQSVVDQSGIYAGSGGFDISVGNHTQLDGAVIASDASADKNRLSTGTLGWNDIENQSKWSGKEVSVSVSTNSMPTTGAGMVKDDKTSTTGSAVAPGTIYIRNPDAQTQDIADLSRDTDSAHHALENDFDAEKIRTSLEIQKEAVALGTQALNAYKSSKMREAAEKNAELKAELAAKEGNQNLTQEQLDAKVQADPRYIDSDKEYGVGSQFWTTGTAVTGLLAGVLGGNVQGGMAAGAAPFLAGLVKAATQEAKDDSAAEKAAKQAANIALHGLVSAALAQAQGANALGAAAGGMTAAALSNALAQKLYGKNADDLQGEQRDILSTLVTLMGSTAGLAAGGDGYSAASAGNAARVEVENNTLGCPPTMCLSNGVDVMHGGGGMGGGSSAGGSAAVGLGALLSEIFGSGESENPNVGANATDAEKTEIGGTGSGSGAPLPPDDEEPKNQQEDKPSNIKMADDKYLKRNGIDAHKLKEEFLGDGKNSNYDIYINKDSGELWIFRKGGKGDGIATGEFIK